MTLGQFAIAMLVCLLGIVIALGYDVFRRRPDGTRPRLREVGFLLLFLGFPLVILSILMMKGNEPAPADDVWQLALTVGAVALLSLFMLYRMYRLFTKK